ncbi:chloride channel CLIC-like protein 1 isoform X2 [Cololabis saira]|uniref:chloride channel CLIC-like protein 1 isoform X2 n=1 Tax=Cololabis saira TaxID=129043 RepID=UPI002AD4C611|nr:chloride channel CLIC-like protein 1 isoform X2 [Cololabis saira]
MRLLVLVSLLSLSLSADGQRADEDWLDPYDMLNYDASTKTMRKPAEPTSHTDEPPKRRELIQDPSQAELTACRQEVAELQRKHGDQQKTIKLMSQQPTCNPVFKRFLSRLLKEIKRVGVPSDSTDVFYDAKVKLSMRAVAEIQSLLDGEDRWRTGALDDAISQILVDLKPHDYEAWKWHFEDSFGVDLDTVLKIGMFVLIISATICTQLWSKVSWFVQFRRLFAVCFFVSILWNWFYLYKIAFAEHQNNIIKMDSVNDKCTGVKKIDWSDSLKEWFRSTWTLQDDPCKRYYEVLMVNPVLLVPPTKAISLTITTFITDPLKHIGQGISEFLRALLKDLPFTLQIPVLLTIVFSILVVVYGSVQAVFQHGLMAPLRRPRRDPPPPELEEPQRRPLRLEDRRYLGGGDAPAPEPEPEPEPQYVPRHRVHNARIQRNNIHQRRVREEPAPIRVQTLRAADPQYSEDEMDNQRHQESPEPQENLSAESDSENQQEMQKEINTAGANGGAVNTVQSKPKHTKSVSSQSKLRGKEDVSQDEASGDGAGARSQPPEEQSSQTDVHDPDVSAEDRRRIELIGVPVQETGPAAE